jgi:hypothetical protein
VRDSRVAVGLLALTVSAVILTFVGLSVFGAPAADDYCYAVKARTLGLLPSQAAWYAKWSGRYTGTFLLSAFGLTDIERTYALVGAGAVLSTVLAMLALTAAATGDRLRRGWTWLSAGVLAALYLAGLPDVSQTVYWATGSLIYQVGNVGLVLLVAVLVCRERHALPRPLRWLLWLAGAALVALLQGTNDVTMLLTTFLLAAGTVLALRGRRDSAAFWVGLLALALLAGGVAELAPGNFARAAALTSSPQLRPEPLLAAVLFLPWTLLRAAYWLSSLALWAATALLVGASLPWARAHLHRDGRFDRRYLWLPAGCAGAYLVLSLLGFVVNRYPLPERAESVLWVLFLLGWLPSAVVLAHWVGGEALGQRAERLRIPTLLLLAVSLLGSANNFEAFKDAYRGYRYYVEMAERRRLIEAAKASGQEDLVIPSLSRTPRTLLATELTTDAGNLRNRCLADYHGLRSIRLGSPEPNLQRSTWMSGKESP